tara:strand:- start:3324 stop:3905 length:582 start_codon:yes stop_codon:yes gene_type:complete
MVKASQDIEPGDYNVPYSLSYVDSEENFVQKSGSIGIVVGAETELDFNFELERNVVGEQGQVSLRIINEGFGDIKFVSVRIVPEGFTIIGTESEYIGTIDSDDFETATFDVLFDSDKARILAVINYKDFGNVEQIENVNRDLKVYSVEEGIELGIIERNNSFMYVILIVVIVGLWLVYRSVKKRRKLRKKLRD